MIVVERIEDSVAVLEIRTDDGSTTYHNVPMRSLKIAVCAGDVLVKTANGWQVDADATAERKQQAVARWHRLVHHEK